MWPRQREAHSQYFSVCFYLTGWPRIFLLCFFLIWRMRFKRILSASCCILNALTISWIWKFLKSSKRKTERKTYFQTCRARTALSCLQAAGEPHIICLRAESVGLDVLAHVCVCLSLTLTVIYSFSHTLPFCLLVNCHGEGGYNGRLRSTINLDTSYHCLPLQGEACPVANMINPLPLCPQPPVHTLQPPSSLPQQEAMLQGKKTGPPSHLRGKEPSRFTIPPLQMK